MAKKFLIALFIFVSLFISSNSISYAQEYLTGDSPWDPTEQGDVFNSYRDAIEADGCMTPSLECLVHQVFTFSALEFVNSTLFSEVDPQINTSGTKTNSINNPTQVGSSRGILGGAGKLINTMYAYPAARTSIYVADIMDSAHITPQAQAQGLGFSALNPILDLWKAFRNVAYMFFVIIFIVIGFMIMFRQKMGGQAAVTAQQAIPGVIISLILVTFSYAIAGLLIDFMYLLMFFIGSIFVGDEIPNFIDMNILQVGGELFFGGDINGIDNYSLVENLINDVIVGHDTTTAALSVLGGLTMTVVIAIAILLGTVKLFFELLKSYASIIISIVTSPLTLMMGAIPGKNTFVTWLKDLIGNLLPFPVVLFVLVLFYQFKKDALGGGISGGFMPPFLLANGSADAITGLLGLALILALPEIVKHAKKGLVQEGFGTMIFKAATESAASGWSGGQPIKGIPVKIPGVKTIGGNILTGTDKSRKRHEADGKNDLRLGLLGGGRQKWRRWKDRVDKGRTSQPSVDTSEEARSKPETPQGTGAQSGGGGLRR